MYKDLGKSQITDTYWVAYSHHSGGRRKFKDDLETTFYMMIYLADIRIPWEHEREPKKYGEYKANRPALRVSEMFFFFLLKCQTKTTISNCIFVVCRHLPKK